MRHTLASTLAAVGFCVVVTVGLGQSWQSCESYTPMPGEHHRAFEIGCWGTHDGRRFVGHFTYVSQRYPDDPPVATLHGKAVGDRFWPNVTFQVSRHWHGPWKTIARRHTGGDALVVNPQNGSAALEASLDPFKPWLGKLDCGRIVLDSGESATFDIQNLRPPDKRPKP